MGRNMPSLDVLCQSTFQESNITRVEEISCKESGTLSREDSKDGTKYNTPPSESKPHVFTRKKQVKRFMFSVSIRCGPSPPSETILKHNAVVAPASRVKTMLILQKASNIALTKEQSIYCRHPLGNCPESVPWEALRGQRKSRRNRAVLYSRTLALPKRPGEQLKVSDPCLKCQNVLNKMNHFAIVHLW